MAEAVCKMSLFSSCGRWPELGSDRGGSRPFFASTSSRSSPLSSRKSGYLGRRLVIERQNGILPRTKLNAVPVEMALSVGKAMKWWAKEAHPNMKEISSAQDLADSLSSAGDKLVIVDFFSPGCGGCRSLHPKICQFAEKNPDVLFLQTNYEEHKSMCYSLSVHVLPFFRFYRGAQGRLCSFSCTNATIKKFKDALAKNSAKRCSLGPAKGLEESELMALAANRDLFFSFPEKEAPEENAPRVYNPAPSIPGLTAMACAGRWAA